MREEKVQQQLHEVQAEAQVATRLCVTWTVLCAAAGLYSQAQEEAAGGTELRRVC